MNVIKKLILGHFLPKNPSARFFPKKTFESILSLYAAVTLGPFLSKNFKTQFFAKNHFAQFLNLHAAVTSCKKSDKFQ